MMTHLGHVAGENQLELAQLTKLAGVLCRGSVEQKLRLCFRFFDLNGRSVAAEAVNCR